VAGFSPRIMPCPLEIRQAALEVLYCRIPECLRCNLITEVLDEANRGELDLSGLWVIETQSGKIVGALLTQPLAGKAVAVWAPEVEPCWHRARLAASLLRRALADLKARGFRLAQAVIDETASRYARADLHRGGMPRITELLYLERDTTLPVDSYVSSTIRPHQVQGRGRGSPFRWCSFQPAVESEFHRVLQATYIGSLDMPELDRARALNDIMAGRRAACGFVAERWQLGYLPGQPEAAAVLLLGEAAHSDSWEVVYLGLTPEARGQGLGHAIVAHAIELARSHVRTLELAVDCRNIPALRLYESTGFIPRDRRAVHLAILDDGAS
jgi:mycothiol synthase